MFKGAYRGKKVLVTGHTGFKGSWLSIWLNKLGAEVIGYALNPPTEPSMFDACKLDEVVTSIIGDVRDEEHLAEVFEKYQPEMVFHLAAQPLVRRSYKFPKETYETNVIGTANVLEQARNTDSVRAVIVVTSDKCYQNMEWVYGYRETDPLGGHDPYSSSKACAELVVASYKNSFFSKKSVPLASVRAGNVIGGGDWAEDRLVPDFVRAVTQDRPITIRNPSAVRPWQHVLEPLSGYLWLGALMLQDPESYSSAWNFGPTDADVITVEELLNLLIKEWGKGSIVVSKDSQLHESTLLKLDTSKARAYLKWNPVYTVEEAVKKTVQWYKVFYEKTTEKDMYEFTVNQIEEYENEAQKQGLKWSE